MDAIDRDSFERICVRFGWGIQRHGDGLFKGHYCDQRTMMAFELLREYLQAERNAVGK